MARDHVGPYQRVDLACCVAFKAAHYLALSPSFGGASLQVGTSALVLAHAGDHDAMQRGVGLPVPASVEPTAPGLARTPYL
jgi:hypothetical protein